MKLKYAASLHAGGTPPVDDVTMWSSSPDEGTPWVSIGDMSQGGLITSTDRRISDAGIANRRLTKEDAGTVLFAMYASVGAVATLGFQATWNQALLGIRPLPGRADGRFLSYWLQHVALQTKGLVRASTQDNLNGDQVANFPFTDLHVDEQRRIADFLDDQVARIDNIIAARKRQVSLLNEALASDVYAEVTGRDHLDRQSSRLAWAADLPATWPCVRLALVARIGTGHTPSRSQPEYWRDCDIPWLTTTDVFKFRFQQIDLIDDTEVKISSLGLANSSAVMHPSGTVALSRTSGSAGFAILMGRAMATSQDFATWTPGPKLRSEYLLWCLRTMHHDLMGRLAMGSTHLTIYFPDLLSIQIPLPPLSDQDEAVRSIRGHIDASRAHGSAARKSVLLFEELKRSLITAAVTGEFDVSTADGSQVLR